MLFWPEFISKFTISDDIHDEIILSHLLKSKTQKQRRVSKVEHFLKKWTTCVLLKIMFNVSNICVKF